MPLLQPEQPPYDALQWRTLPWSERIRLATRAWAVQGYGAPVAVYLLYALKVLFYIGAWCWFCSFSTGLGDPLTLTSWCFEPVAFQKAVLWSMAFESLGLGCASGPLTGRYHPPIGGMLYFLRPGTAKLSLLPRLPLLGGNRRRLLDVALYATHLILLARALVAPELGVELLLPIVVLVPVLGLADKTLFLAARGEHYYVTTVCFLFVDDWIAGAMAVQLAIWLWAATSKLNHHFPAVVCVMTSNSPSTPFVWLRKQLYRSYPDDLRPSKWAYLIAHVGTAVEFIFPVLLVVGTGGWCTTVGLAMMVAMHVYITSNIPLAAPIEWNFHVVYGGFFLFAGHPEVSVFSIADPTLASLLVGALVVIPLIGQLAPDRVSFLLAMRYYAGNWAYGIWLFRRQGDTRRKLDRELTKSSAWIEDQLARYYDEQTIAGVMSKVPAFRAMHLHGRALHDLLGRAVDDIEAYHYVDGEVVAGITLGWNFGDGHLHNERLLSLIQERCQFQDGDLRCIFVESQPLLGSALPWRIVDAASGELARGQVPVATLLQRQPWPAQTNQPTDRQAGDA